MVKSSDPVFFPMASLSRPVLTRCVPVVFLAALTLLPACSKEEPTSPVASSTEQTASSVAAQAAAQEATLAGMSAEELKKRASQSMREQRLYAPAGDNAMEYYMALRNKNAKPDPAAESALTELMPYAVIAAEQAIGRDDFLEAERLRTLLEKSDPRAPALPRITNAIAKGKLAVEQRVLMEAERTEQQAKQAKEKEAQDAKLKAAQAAQIAATTAKSSLEPVVTPPVTTSNLPASTPVSTSASTPTSSPTSSPPVTTEVPRPTVSTPSVPAPSVSAPARSSELVPIATPQPVYPAEARRSGTTGAVTVSFTVNSDGSVSNINIISARPRGVFDRSVQSAVRRWKYKPISQAQSVTRTFDFKL